METANVVEGFVIQPDDQTEPKFYKNPTNQYRKAMLSACDRLLHKDETYEFLLPQSCCSTLVSGEKQRGYDEKLPVRIDIQGKILKDIGGRKENFANVQVQINGEKPPSTIAQVNFESGIHVPRKVIQVAFEGSYDRKRILWVYKKL